MAGQNPHHRSKKRQISFVVIPDGDDSRSKFFKLAPWQIGFFSVAGIAAIIGLFLLLIIFTPLGAFLNIPNPGIELRYNRELVNLNQRLEAMMKELVDLRAYSVKVRNVLGEKVVATDSGVVVLQDRKIATKETPSVSDQSTRTQAFQSQVRMGNTESYGFPSSSATRVEEPRVVFPAILPSDGYISRGFNPAARHYGLDVAGKVGSLVVAAADGYIVFAGWTNEEGYVMIMSHPNGFLTFYKHNQSLLKNENMFVKRGEPIALLGNTGSASYGPHLHFEIWKDGSPVDPFQYLLNIKS